MAGWYEVSILIRPEGRMQRYLPELGRRSCFNPHPARRPDATSARSAINATTLSFSFNPHPARRPDATPDAGLEATRRPRFNPHPARRPDATGLANLECLSFAEFQSSSGQKAGCNHIGQVVQPEFHQLCFNPHPARRPDATGPCRPTLLRAVILGFQSSSGQKAGCNANAFPFGPPGRR